MRHRASSHIAPAVVAGIDLNGLGVLRSLGREGVPIVAVDTDLGKPECWTRFATKKCIQALSGPVFIDALLELRQTFTTNPVLILTQEASVTTVSAARDRLEQHYRFSMPEQGLMEDLLDKARFHSLAERHGLPLPRTIRLTRASGTAALRALRFPCVLKPTTKHAEYATRFAKAYRVSEVAEVERLWTRMCEVIDEAVVQEWIEGGDADVYFCLQYRAATKGSVSFVGRKLCQWPPLVGGTASCMPAPEVASELIALTDRFFGVVNFKGICSMEYKRDGRDGKFYVVEPTVGRTDYQEEIATLNGLNIPLAAYLGELGEPLPEALCVSPPRAWRDPVGYAKARGAGSSDPLRQLAPNAKICDAYFRFTDPMPSVALKLEGVRRRLAQAAWPIWSHSASAGESQNSPKSAP